MTETDVAVADPTTRERPSQRVRTDLGTWAVLTVLGTVGTWSVLRLVPAELAGASVVAVLVAGAIATAVVASAWSVLAWRRPVPLVLSAASLLLGGTAMSSLHGTAWGFDGVYSDAGFRTQMVTRYADSPALADYGYAGLPAYYPPLWPWLQGRAAALLDVPGWTVMKPAQVLMCLVLPTLSWLLWRRVLSDMVAAWVASVVASATVLAHKPDEWLVLCLLLPWWLEVCRGMVRADAAPWGAARHGLVLGLLLLTHTYFFAPLALATLLGMLLDLVRRRPVHPAPLRAVRIGAVGLVVALPTWWHLLAGELAGLPSDDLQRRWSPHGFDAPAIPLPYDARGVLELAGLLWLLRHARRSRLAAALLLALLASYAFMVGGQLLQPLGVALLPEKTEELSEAVLAAAGVLGVAAAASWCRRRLARPGTGRAARAAAVGATALSIATGALAVTATLERGVVAHAGAAQTMRYPDGSFPAGGAIPADENWHPWGVAPGAVSASAAQVEAAWRELSGRPFRSGDVLVSSRADVPALRPVHLFLSWKSIYSHPHGRFESRLAVLRRLQECEDAACAHRLLRDNPLQAVDGLVLNRDDRGYYLSVTIDDFPEAWIRQRVSLDPGLFASPDFEVVELARTAVILVAP
ncbi:arabinofuranosyltransferase [Nocardioides aequoreus]|uniref:arabinofuranosyltransferase n=1 Tax=Nocardioides aequoreus TaxID=397278 RepID=UPI0004C30A64|nr:arabinofuranosyltransferase [Nocardioides aequoreus]